MVELTLAGRVNELIELFRDNKPNDRSEKDRKFAIVLTDLEKISAYVKTYLEDEE